MPFLSSAIVWLFESWLGKAILKIIWDDLSGFLTEYIAKKKQEAANVAAAKASVQPLKDAKTGTDVDKASDSSLNGV